MPKMYFANGITGGKLMAKEYRGILLLMAITLRSTKGRAIARNRRPFKEDSFVDDWIMLLETLLQWESWLRKDVMEKKHVRALMEKNRRLMYLIRKVGKKTSGMGLKTVKFHGITHIAQCILDFGVPTLYDTSQPESHHKPSKKAAKLTQKRRETFDEQTAKRLQETNLLAMATEELKGRPVWNYWGGHDREEQVAPEEEDVAVLGGERLRCVKWEDGKYQMLTDKKKMGRGS
jgi:hypothetical protein